MAKKLSNDIISILIIPMVNQREHIGASEEPETRLTMGELLSVESLIGKSVTFYFQRNILGPYTVTSIEDSGNRWQITVKERPQSIMVDSETEIAIAA